MLLDPRGEAELLIENPQWIESRGSFRLARPGRTYSDVQFIEESGDVVGTELTLIEQGEKTTAILRFFEGAEAPTSILTGTATSLRGHNVQIDGRVEGDVFAGTLKFTNGGTVKLRLTRAD